MVKTPKARHSKTTRDPVTIDLDPASVSRVPRDETAEAEAAAAEPTATPEEGAATTNEESQPVETSPEGVSTTAQASQEERPWSPRDVASEEAAEVADGRAAAEAERREQERHEQPGEAMSAAVPPARTGGTGTAILGGIVGAVLALVVAGLLQWSGMLPGSPAAAGNGDDGALRQDVASLEDKVAALGSGSGGQDLSALGGRVDDLDEQVKGLKDGLAKAEQQMDAGNGADTQAFKDQLADLQKQVQTLSQSASGANALQGRVEQLEQGVQAAKDDAGQIDTNAQKLTDLQTQLKQLADKLTAQQEQPSVARLVAATALKSAVDRGVGFSGELQAYAKLAPGGAELEPLGAYAQKGVPTHAALAEQVSDVATRIVSAQRTETGDEGVAQRLWDSAAGLVKVRPVGQVEGSGVPAIAARFEADVKAGDYDKALAEYGKLPDASKKEAADFADKLKARQAADRLMDQALSGALKAG